MAYTMDESHSSPNFTSAENCMAAFGYPRTIIGTTIHHWDAKGSGASWDGTMATLMNDYRNPGARGVSAHYMVETGRAACLVSVANAAWHAGNPQGNAQTVGIELNPDESEGTYQTAAEVIAQIWLDWGIPHDLFPHNHWTSTGCPGDYNLLKLARMAEDELAKLNGTTPAAQPAAPQSSTPVVPIPSSGRKTYSNDAIHWDVQSGDTLTSIADYYGIPERVQAIADYNGIDANHIAPGDQIWIPGQLVWTIEAPDTIRTIATYYGLDAGYLASMNGLSGPDAEIYIGNTLTIQGG